MCFVVSLPATYWVILLGVTLIYVELNFMMVHFIRTLPTNRNCNVLVQLEALMDVIGGTTTRSPITTTER
jgi:hypothetical protein